MKLTRRRLAAAPVALLLGATPPHAAFGQIVEGPIMLWLAKNLAEGAVSYIGGRLMAQALGDSATIGDVKVWIGQAVAEIEAYVSAAMKQAFTQYALSNIQADFEQIRTNLDHYKNTPTAEYRYLLENCDVASARLLPFALQYDQALLIAAAAMLYRLITLNALYELDQRSGRTQTAIGTMQTAKANVDTFLIRARPVSLNLIAEMSPAKHLSYNPPPSPFPLGARLVWIVREDGAMQTFTSPDAARAYYDRRQAELSARWQAFNRDIQQVTGAIITCCTTMLAKVNLPYTPPAMGR